MARRKLDGSQESKRMNFYMPEKQVTMVNKLAKLTHKSTAQFIREACRAYAVTEAKRLRDTRDAEAA